MSGEPVEIDIKSVPESNAPEQHKNRVDPLYFEDNADNVICFIVDFDYS